MYSLITLILTWSWHWSQRCSWNMNCAINHWMLESRQHPSYYGTHAPQEHAIAPTPEYLKWQQLDWQALAARPPKAGQNNGIVLLFLRSRAKLRTGSNGNDKIRHLGDSNPCGQSPADFESASLTTRTRCLRHECGILWYLVYLFVELAEFAKIMLILHVPNANHIQHHGRAHLGTSVWCVCLARTSFQPWWACCRSLIWSLSSTLLSS